MASMVGKITNRLLARFEHQVLIGLVLGVLVAGGVGFYGDFVETGVRLVNFSWWLVPAILGLTMGNYILRTVRWQIFLQALGVKIDWQVSWWVFISGLAMTVTPGRVGELVKSYFLKKLAGVEVSKTAPLVVFERLSDGLAMVVLMSGGLMLTRYGIGAVFFSVGMAVLFIWLLHQRVLVEKILSLTLHLPVISKYFGHLNNFYQSSQKLGGWRPLLAGWLLSLLAWSAEAYGFYLVLVGLGVLESWRMLLLAVFIFGFAAIAGFATFLPGGLGVAEGTFVGLLVLLVGVDNSTAAAATLLIRLMTLWFGVGWGVVGLVYLGRKLKKG
jgi:uncharacterized protein (TIRG00374 family)